MADRSVLLRRGTQSIVSGDFSSTRHMMVICSVMVPLRSISNGVFGNSDDEKCFSLVVDLVDSLPGLLQ